MLRCDRPLAVSGPLGFGPCNICPTPHGHGPAIPAWAAKANGCFARLGRREACQPAAGPPPEIGKRLGGGPGTGLRVLSACAARLVARRQPP